MSLERKKKKYITISSGTDFRKIAKIMTKAGFKMNHATSRNVLMSAMKNLLCKTTTSIGLKISEEKIEEIVKDNSIHDALADILFAAHKKEKNDNN